MNNPFDLLKKSPRRRVLEVAAISGATLLVVTGAIFGISALNHPATDEDKVVPASVTDETFTPEPSASPTETPTVEPTVEPVVEEPVVPVTPPVAPPAPPAPKVCPGGTTMVEGDASGPTGCLPDYCLGALPDPVPAECSVIIRP